MFGCLFRLFLFDEEVFWKHIDEVPGFLKAWKTGVFEQY